MEHQLLAIRSHVEVSSAFHFQGATYHWSISFRHGLLDPVWPVRAYQYVQPRWFEIRPTLHSFSFRCRLLLSTFFVVLYQYSICGLGDSFFFFPQRAKRATRKTELVTWRGWWWGRQDIQAKPRKVTFASTLLLKQVNVENFHSAPPTSSYYYGEYFGILGNLGRVDYVSEFEYDLYIRSDSCNPRHRFWFNFTIDNVRLDQVTTISFELKCKKFNYFSFIC